MTNLSIIWANSKFNCKSSILKPQSSPSRPLRISTLKWLLVQVEAPTNASTVKVLAKFKALKELLTGKTPWQLPNVCRTTPTEPTARLALNVWSWFTVPRRPLSQQRKVTVSAKCSLKSRNLQKTTRKSLSYLRKTLYSSKSLMKKKELWLKHKNSYFHRQKSRKRCWM